MLKSKWTKPLEEWAPSGPRLRRPKCFAWLRVCGHSVLSVAARPRRPRCLLWAILVALERAASWLRVQPCFLRPRGRRKGLSTRRLPDLRPLGQLWRLPIRTLQPNADGINEATGTHVHPRVLVASWICRPSHGPNWPRVNAGSTTTSSTSCGGGGGAYSGGFDPPIHLGHSLVSHIKAMLGTWGGTGWPGCYLGRPRASDPSATPHPRGGRRNAALGLIAADDPTARVGRRYPTAHRPDPTVAYYFARQASGSSSDEAGLADSGPCACWPYPQHRWVWALHSAGMALPFGAPVSGGPLGWHYLAGLGFAGFASCGHHALYTEEGTRRARTLSFSGPEIAVQRAAVRDVRLSGRSSLADRSRHEGVTWHLHESLFWPFLSLGAVVLYRIFRLCTVFFQEASGRRRDLQRAIFFLRVIAAGLWLLACIHCQFHLVCCLALCSELGAFLLARIAQCHRTSCQVVCEAGTTSLVSRLLSRLELGLTSLKSRDRRSGKFSRRARPYLRQGLPSSWKTGLLLYLCCVDASALHVGSAMGEQLLLSTVGVVQGVQLMAHGFHEGRPVFSTGTIPPAQSEADLCEVVPLGRSCNLLLPPSSRSRRQVAVFLGRPLAEPPLLPCPITMLADERLHGSALHRRILLNLGAGGTQYSSILLQSPLPGLPAEQLLFLPPDLGWNDVLLPIDLRPLGGAICLVRDQRSATCGQLLAAALESQGRFRALQGVLGRCCLGWFSLGSQPLILPGVDALQFAYGPEPNQVQPLFGASLEPPFTLDTLMQVSAVQAGPPIELFTGFSANVSVHRGSGFR